MSSVVRQLFDHCAAIHRSSDGISYQSVRSDGNGKNRENTYDLLVELRDGTYAVLEYFEDSKLFGINFTAKSKKNKHVFLTRAEVLHDQPLSLVEENLKVLQGALPFPPEKYLYWYYQDAGNNRRPMAIVAYDYEKERAEVPKLKIALPEEATAIPSEVARLTLKDFWKKRQNGNIELVNTDQMVFVNGNGGRVERFIWCGNNPPAELYANWGFNRKRLVRGVLSPDEQNNRIEQGAKVMRTESQGRWRAYKPL